MKTNILLPKCKSTKIVFFAINYAEDAMSKKAINRLTLFTMFAKISLPLETILRGSVNETQNPRTTFI